MKKTSKAKRAKAKNELPELVTVMMRVAERLDALEKKMDQVIGQTTARSSAPAVQAPPSRLSGPGSPQSQGSVSGQTDGHRERVLYKVICADCYKNCEVPFKPAGGRPVYCKECFAIRKAGHRPLDPDKLKPAHPPKKIEFAPMDSVIEPVLKGKKSKKT